MSNIELILIMVFAPVAIIAFIVLLIYLIGNVYNGLVRRLEKVKNSWHELSKIIYKYFDLIPEYLKTLGEESDKEALRKIYSDCKTAEKKRSIDETIKAYFNLEEKLYEIRKKSDIQSEAAEFIAQYRRTIKFSIPLYNTNVKGYNHFRQLWVNRAMARIFHFEAAKLFFPAREAPDESLSL